MATARDYDVLLDANVCIHLVNGSSPALVARMARYDPGSIKVSSVVKAELLFGARISTRSAENLRLLEKFFAPFVSLPFDDRCADRYGVIRADLRRLGQMIGPNDLLIAATAITNDLTLVTHNVKEFGRIPGLLIEDWETEG